MDDRNKFCQEKNQNSLYFHTRLRSTELMRSTEINCIVLRELKYQFSWTTILGKKKKLVKIVMEQIKKCI